MNDLQRLQQKLYDIVCIADKIRSNDKTLSSETRYEINQIVELSDLESEFK